MMSKILEFTRLRKSRQQRSNENGNNLMDDGDILNSDFMSRSVIENDRSNNQDSPPNQSALDRYISRRKSHRFSYKIMRVVGNILAVITTIAFLVLVPMITYHAMIYEKARADFAAFYSAGAFVLITVVMSTKQIYGHLTNWYMPDVQKYVVRILWMVPIYAVQSWLSLRYHEARLYIDILRDLYEAYVIQSFLYYLMELLGGEDTLVQLLQEKDAYYGNHPGFFKFFFPSWEMGYDFMFNCKHGVIQYVVVKIIGTILTAILEPIGLFNEGDISWTKGYVYISFMINLSQMWALYCLVKFYHATHDDLNEWRPMGKFLCIKGVVFFTWWQGVALAVVKSRGMMPDIGQWDMDDVANGVQDYLICVEMFCFAIAHSFTFTYKEYLPSRRGVGGGGISRGNSAEADGRDHDGEISLDYTEFRPPVIRTLNTPMGFRDAFWSSTVPNETLNDIRRFRTGALDQSPNQSSDIGMLRNVSIQHAESV
jgi:hypothetical protein